MTAVELTDAELARIREILFRELREAARLLVGLADGAAQNEPADGGDALATYRLSIVPTAELLDRIGWSTDRDLALALRDEDRRRLGDVERQDRTRQEVRE